MPVELLSHVFSIALLPARHLAIYRDLYDAESSRWPVLDGRCRRAARRAKLVTALDDGTPLKVAERWWVASQTLLQTLEGWAASDAPREWLDRNGEPGTSR